MALSSHFDPDAGDSDVDLYHRIISPELASTRMWRPKRVLLTQTARDWPHGLAIAERCAAFGIEVIELSSDRLGILSKCLTRLPNQRLL